MGGGRIAAAVVFAAALLAPAAAGALPAPVTLAGVGGVHPGMTAAQVARLWGIPVRPRATPGLDCATAPIRKGALHGYALFERGKLGAVFFDRGARTDRGIGIGSTAAALRRAYRGRLVSRPHKYVRGGRYYFVGPASRWRIRFDTNARGRITQVAFGAAAVELVEGCS